MQQGLKTKLNPIVIIGVWTISMVVLTPIFMYISNIGASGGEQKPLTTLATMINATLYGAAIISISTAIIFRQWFKRNWWYVFVIAITIIPTALDIWDNHSKIPYGFSEVRTNVNGNEIMTKTEYYDDFNTIRSVSIWKNSKKDSVWKTFSKDGEIISQQTFKNDTLVEK
jgi:hypothetical protein